MLVLLPVLWLAWRFQPVPDHIENSTAYLCGQDYARARTAGDTTDIDRRIWQTSRMPWRRIPSCGELRRAGKVR